MEGVVHMHLYNPNSGELIPNSKLRPIPPPPNGRGGTCPKNVPSQRRYARNESTFTQMVGNRWHRVLGFFRSI